MKRSILLLASTFFLLASCGTESPNQPDKQGKHIGTWMAYPESAVWIGTKGIQNMPTTLATTAPDDSIQHITTPNGQYITITKLRNTNFNLTVVDSTMNVTSDEIKGDKYTSTTYRKYAFMKLAGKVSQFSVWPQNFFHGISKESLSMMKLNRNLTYHCNESPTDESAKMVFKIEKYHWHYSPESSIQTKDTIITKHVFDISGLYPTLDYMLCN